MHSRGNHLKKESPISTSAVLFSYLPPANEVWGKVIFLPLSVILFTGGMLSQHALQVVSQHALQQVSSGVVSQHALQVSPKSKGKFRGSGWGGLQAHTQGGSWGGSGPGPQPRGKLRRIWAGGVPSQGGFLLQGGGVCGDPPVTATAAGGTYPTGMHSCLLLHWSVNKHIFC